MSNKQWMIYGANGYSAQLIAEEAAKRGLRPVLAGRSRAKVEAVAQRLKLPSICFDLEDRAAAVDALTDMHLVIHCAGPFSATSAPMIEACIAARTHYLDITGEISVFEHAHAPAQSRRAEEAGIVLCPGVGFDVIPTDCVAAQLKQALPDATHLTLGFAGSAALSPGTAKTSVEALQHGTQLREDGRISTIASGTRIREIDFGAGTRSAMPISWGDVSTAHVSTGIPNISVYVPASKRTISGIRKAYRLRWLLGLRPVQNFLKRRIEKSVRGPDAARRAKMRTLVWGEASNAAGVRKVARIETPNGYDVTITGPLAISEFLLGSVPEQAGSRTPSQLMGADFVTRLANMGPLKISDS